MKSLSKRLYLKNLFLTAAALSLLMALAFLSHHYQAETDLSANASNTLSETSSKLVELLDAPVNITVYVRPAQAIREPVSRLIRRYQQYKADIALEFIDPATVPETAKLLNIGPQGLIVIAYKGRTETLKFVDETTLTNALLQLSQSSERWVSFLSGHGERSPEGKTNFGFGMFAGELARRNIKADALNLAQIGSIPDNTALLVLASPRVALLPGELVMIQKYIDDGGNLLLFSDPDDKHLQVIEKRLGIGKLQGTVVDTSSSLYGIDDPSFVLVSQYNRHPVTKGMQTLTVYPIVSALKVTEKTEFTAEPILQTIEAAWTETDIIQGVIKFDKDKGEVSGPLTLGMALSRNLDDGRQQRIAVIGDGDFLSNTYLGNVGNLELGMRLFNWLTHDDKFIDVPVKTATDGKLQLSDAAIALIGLGFLFVIPLGLIGAGFFIWRQRKRK